MNLPQLKPFERRRAHKPCSNNFKKFPERHSNVSKDFDKVELDVNEALGDYCLHCENLEVSAPAEDDDVLE